MREILFKAKRIDNGEWVEGGYVNKTDYYGIECDEHYIVDGTVTDMEGYGEHYLVDKDTICQYTGLTDKNGNKIWENDVVDIDHYATKAHKVKCEYGSFCIGINGLLSHYRFNCEVIGNIFDNPELLTTSETTGHADNGGLMPAT